MEDEILPAPPKGAPLSEASASNPPSPRPPPFSSLYFPSAAELESLKASVTEAVSDFDLASAPAPSFEEALAEDAAERAAAAEQKTEAATKAALPRDVKGESSGKAGLEDGEPPPPYSEGSSPLDSFTYVMAAAGKYYYASTTDWTTDKHDKRYGIRRRKQGRKLTLS